MEQASFFSPGKEFSQHIDGQDTLSNKYISRFFLKHVSFVSFPERVGSRAGYKACLLQPRCASRGHSRAHHTPYFHWDVCVIKRIVEMRFSPPENAHGVCLVLLLCSPLWRVGGRHGQMTSVRAPTLGWRGVRRGFPLAVASAPGLSGDYA